MKKTLYILKCEYSKYYVGTTTNLDRRIAEHFNGSGSAWTSKYKPLQTIFTQAMHGIHDENNTTKNYMKKYGIDNVRGGAYANVVLSEDQIKVLAAELLSIGDKCFKCGKDDHMQSECTQQQLRNCPFCQYPAANKHILHKHVSFYCTQAYKHGVHRSSHYY